MNAYVYPNLQTRFRPGGDTTIAVLPSSATYLKQMETCHQLAYGYAPADALEADAEAMTAEKFRQHLAIFPAGQFIALEKATNRVVGLTVSMRVNLDMPQDGATSWAELTNDG